MAEGHDRLSLIGRALWGLGWRAVVWGLLAGLVLGVTYAAAIWPLTMLAILVTGSGKLTLAQAVGGLAALPFIALIGAPLGVYYGGLAGVVLGVLDGLVASVLALATPPRLRRPLTPLVCAAVALAVAPQLFTFRFSPSFSTSPELDVVLFRVIPTLIAAGMSLWLAVRALRWYEGLEARIAAGELGELRAALFLRRHRKLGFALLALTVAVALTGAGLGIRAYQHRPVMVSVPSGSVALSRDGRLLGVLTSSGFEVWDLGAGHRVSSLGVRLREEGNSWVNPWAWSPSRGLLAYEKGSVLRVVGARDGHEVGETDLLGADRLVWSPEGRLLAAVADEYGGSVVRVWRVTDRLEPLYSIPFESYTDPLLAFGPDGSTFVTREREGRVRLWRSSDGRLLGTAFVGGSDVSFSHLLVLGRGGLVATSYSLRSTGYNRTELAILRMSDGRVVRRLDLDPDGFDAFAFSPDGRSYAYGTYHGIVRVEQLDGTEPVRTYRLQPEDVDALAFTPDGSRLVIAGSEGKARILPR